MPRDIVTQNAIAELVDRIGLLKATIAPHQEKLDQLESQLKAYGSGKYPGTAYDATVYSYDRSSLDQDAVRAKLSPQFIRAHTVTKPVTQVRVTARKVPT